MTTNNTTPFDINATTVEGQRARKAATQPSIEEDRRRAAIDPAAARRVAAEAHRVAAVRPAAPVPIRPRPAVASTPEDNRLARALLVLEGVTRYPVTPSQQAAYSAALPLLADRGVSRGVVDALAFACNEQTDTGAAAFTPGAVIEIRTAIRAARTACGLTADLPPAA